MSKSVSVSYEESTARYIADFIYDGDIVDSKALTQIEVDGLIDEINFGSLPSTVDAEALYETIGNCFFDTEDEGQQTNFELMLQDLVTTV